MTKKADYIKSHEWMSNKKYIKEFVNLIALSKNDYVLEAGCGSGYVSSYIRLKVKKLLQIDHDWAMLSRNIITKHAETLKADITNLWMIRNNTFNAIFSRSVLHRIREPQKAYAEFIRTLKNGGKLVVSVSYAPESLLKEYKKILSKKGFRLYLTYQEWRELFSNEPNMKLLDEGEIKFKLNLRTWGLLREHQNSSKAFKAYFKLKNGLIECRHAYFILKKSK